MRRWIWVFVPLICCSGVFAGDSYIFHLKNGQRLVGEIAEENNASVTIETRDGRVTVRKEEIETRTPHLVDREKIGQAEQFVVDRRHLEAILLFRDAYSAAQDPQVREEGRRRVEEVADQWVQQSSRLSGAELDWSDADNLTKIEGLIESADVLERLKAEARRIREVRAVHLDSVAEGLMKEGKYAEAVEIYRDLENHGFPRPSQLANACLRQAIPLTGPPDKDFARALRLLEQAQSADPNLVLVHLYLAHVYLELDNVDAAIEQLRIAAPRYAEFAGTDKNVFDRVFRRLARVSRFPTFAPIPTVSPARIANPTQTTEQKVRFWVWDAKRAYYSGTWKDFFKQKWPYLAAVIGVVLVLWYLPWRYVRRDFSRRTMMGPNWSTIAFFTGVFGLLAYLIMRTFQEIRVPRCKRCGYNLARSSDYTDYDYHHCPSCKAPIRPVFTLNQEIVGRARMLTTMGAAPSLETGSEEELFQILCLHAFRSRAQEVVMEPNGKDLTVFFEVDGIPYPVFQIPQLALKFLLPIARKKANIDSSAPFPQKGYFISSLGEADVEIRLSITPGDLGETFRMRLTDRRESLPNLAQIGLNDRQQTLIKEELAKPSGMIVIAGPPKSGKTTVAYAMLAHLNDGRHYMASIEKGIHAEVPGVTQIEEGRGGMYGRQILEAAVRQNINVLFVDEIRDRESAEYLLGVSSTNRRTILCLESADTVQALERFLNNDLPPELLANSLSLIVAVRLVRKLCPACKAEGKTKAKDLERLGLSPDVAASARVFVHAGCEECMRSGYRGRTGIFEILPISDDLKQAIAAGRSKEEILRIAASARSGVLKTHVVEKVLAGVTDFDAMAGL
ncbi:MAG TPA: ATPase, T2SS/T4P/T4SS family [bacterium]|nr:ATPase, T2SS/T4P/T4SS family [bacterium]